MQRIIETAVSLAIFYPLTDEYARFMTNATVIVFTDTPIESADSSRRGVFGDTIILYDINRNGGWVLKDRQRNRLQRTDSVNRGRGSQS